MPADHSDIMEVEIRLKQCTKDLHDMVEEVAAARQVKEYDSERRKNALSKSMANFTGVSSTQSQNLARTSHSFLQEIESLASQYQEAERAILKWQATLASFEAARSLLSFSRETLRQL